jgi:adenylosuccinate synthase
MLCSRKVCSWFCALSNHNCFLGLDCTGRLFISDRAHLVFDFHQIVDGLKEVELGGSRHGYSCVATSSLDVF